VKDTGRLFWLIVGMVLGGTVVGAWLSRPQAARAASGDRFDDYVLCTGGVLGGPRGPTLEGVWLLDYRAGKLLGTVVDKAQGKIAGWAEVDLVNEFGLPPRANVHFLMTTGKISVSQSALYVAETTSGKFGVYTMGLRPDGQAGIAIKRHDLVLFRQGQGQGKGG
jgi:hypothetical protein